jgi:hypothetical protein
MRVWLGIVFAAVLSSSAHADNAACWGGGQDDRDRPDISCVPLTEPLLISLEGATRAEVVAAMKAPGLLADNGSLRFESNYAFRTKGDVGSVAVKFGADGRVDAIDAAVEAPHHGQGIRFDWNAAVAGCSDFPDSIQRCENIEGEPRPVEREAAQRNGPFWAWLPHWLARHLP